MKRKVKWKNVILLVIMLICFSGLVYSSCKIISRLKQKNDTNKLIENINSLVEIKEEIGDTSVVDDVLEKYDEEEKINYYYDYLKISFLDVDFSKLKSINSEVKGWLNVVGSSVNYPYVQTTNNNYYLTHSFDKSKNAGGWVFLDYRNNFDNQDKNTIIYAHGGLSLAMFGPLKKLYDKTDWFSNPDNHYIKIGTENYNFVYKVFSLYVIDTTNDYLKINFENDEKYQEFLDMLVKRSHYKFETNVLKGDRIITLSTCYNSSQKLVIHAKLIKEIKK